MEATIRSGDVVSDLAKPFSHLGYWLARDSGRAPYFMLFRMAPVLLVGQAVFGLRWPTSPVTWLAIAVSFAGRFMINLTAFWTTDARGFGSFSMAVVLFLGGFLLPLRFFPE